MFSRHVHKLLVFSIKAHRNSGLFFKIIDVFVFGLFFLSILIQFLSSKAQNIKYGHSY